MEEVVTFTLLYHKMMLTVHSLWILSLFTFDR